MKEADKIDIRSLQEQAKRSEDHEAFRVLSKLGNCRIGVGARLEPSAEPIFFVEVLVNLCAGHGNVDLDLMEKKVSLLSRLKKRGYLLNCEEDGCVSCELAVPSKDLVLEFEVTNSMVKNFTE